MSMPRALPRDLEKHDSHDIKQDTNMTLIDSKIRQEEHFTDYVRLHNKIYSSRCHNYKQCNFRFELATYLIS
jgi:hypothetical protein